MKIKEEYFKAPLYCTGTQPYVFALSGEFCLSSLMSNNKNGDLCFDRVCFVRVKSLKMKFVYWYLLSLA